MTEKKEADIFINLHCKFIYEEDNDESIALYQEIMDDLYNDVRNVAHDYPSEYLRVVNVEASG